MLKHTIARVFGTRQQREVKRLTPLVKEIHRHEERLARAA